MLDNFADQLLEKVEEKESRLFLGLRPSLSQVPSWIMDEKKQEFGRNWAAISEAFITFDRFVIEAVAQHVIGIMPRLSHYQMYGAYGLRALERTIVAALENELLVIIDSKFADYDPATTLTGQAFIGAVPAWDNTNAPSNLHVHAMTLVPHYGLQMLKDYIDLSAQNKRGLLLLANADTASYNLAELAEALVGEKGLSSLGILFEGLTNSDDETLYDNSCLKLYRGQSNDYKDFSSRVRESNSPLERCFYVAEDSIVAKVDKSTPKRGEDEDLNIQAKFEPCSQAAEAIKEEINGL